VLLYAQDDENMFMVIDLMLGGDLRFHLDRMGPMSEDLVRFYMAETAFALQYLHQHNIVHRYAPYWKQMLIWTAI
jgi:serine/threonine kinase 32